MFVCVLTLTAISGMNRANIHELTHTLTERHTHSAPHTLTHTGVKQTHTHIQTHTDTHTQGARVKSDIAGLPTSEFEPYFPI